MVERIGKSPEEIEALEGYRQAFVKVMASRGLSTITIEAKNNTPFLEARCGEDDGSIDLPTDLERAFCAPYEGIAAPQGGVKPLLVTNVALGLHEGRIEVEPRLVRYTSGPKIEGYVTTAEAGEAHRAMSSETILDFDKGVYSVEVVKIDDKGSIVGESDEEHKLTPGMVASLGALLPRLDARQNSEVIVKKNPPNNLYNLSLSP